jgi:hypothetical protein
VSVEARGQIGTRAKRRGLKQLVERRHVRGEHRGRPFDARPLHIVQQDAEHAYLAQHHQYDQQDDIARQ